MNARFDNEATNFEVFALDRWAVHEYWTLIFALQASSGRREVSETTISAPAATDVTNKVSETYAQISPGLVLSIASHQTLMFLVVFI